MFENSILRKTGQWWKFLLWGAGVITALACMIYGFYILGGDSGETWGEVGIWLMFFTIGFGFQAIRCPACGAHWFWLKFGQVGRNCGLMRLLRNSDCPVCHEKFHVEVS